MLFNSFEFIFLFLPLALGGYFALGARAGHRAAVAWLALASLAFYGWWNPAYLLLLGGSIVFNFLVGSRLGVHPHPTPGDRRLLFFGIAANVALLGWYKYTGFLLDNANAVLGTSYQVAAVVLPLGISFFTFTQIAYLVDAYRKEVREYRFVDYTLFVTFFPHLIAGPILHHREIMPQFDVRTNAAPNAGNIACGLFVFALGLGKKLLLADALAPWANAGFEHPELLSALEAWFVVLSYTLQLYFDFSGYCDMAIGIALMFNIRLPVNFDSPYRARGIQDFWRRWHITLSRFLRDYVYIPLGGNRRGEVRTAANLVGTFLLGGFWHGAGWTFIAWGAIHGVALVVERHAGRLGLRLPGVLGWAATFLTVMIAWVFFRATSMDNALAMLQAMAGAHGAIAGDASQHFLPALRALDVSPKPPTLLLGLIICLVAPNSIALWRGFRPTWTHAGAAVLLLTVCCTRLFQPAQFIYFNF